MRAKAGPCPQSGPALKCLKRFQRDAVEAAFERLYLAPDSTHRFLVADEAGLGKTLVARGIVARAVEHLWDQVERIDVVYLCSNARIAKQNVRRLNPFPDRAFAEADRMTMLPVTLSSLAQNDLNFVAFTPSTSLDLKSSEGQKRERALLFWLLRSLWPVDGTGPKNLLQGNVGRTKHWRKFLRAFPERNPISAQLTAAFHRTLKSADRRAREQGKAGLKKRWNELCETFRYSRKYWPDDLRADRRKLVGDLRALLARACVDQLEPDLVILDEFQRFKHLLNPEEGGEAARLAKALFEWQDETAEVRVLLLSATPYKMYTLAAERDEDNHYADFLRTFDFLQPDPGRQASFRGDLEAWRRGIYRLAEDGGGRLRELKGSIETSLRRVMSRTERIGAGIAHDGMVRLVKEPTVELGVRDVRDYVHLQGIADQLGQAHVVEFWKSAPYLLNFMEDYRLKQELREALEDRSDPVELIPRLRRAAEMLLDPADIQAYAAVDPANARLRHLYADVLNGSLWKCLWLPPSLAPYELGEPFSSATARPGGATKRLVFSAWAVVPKAVATLTSYEVERRVFTNFDAGARNTPEQRKRRTPLLRLSRSEGRLTGLPVVAWMYPSPALAELGDPWGAAAPGSPLDEVLDRIESRVDARLEPLVARVCPPLDGPEDESWYWQAPILFDLDADQARTREWWAAPGLGVLWSSEKEDRPAVDDANDRWEDHVQEGRAVALHGPVGLGRPPSDLAEVLALLALAGAGIAALRALARVVPGASPGHSATRMAAARIAWAARSLFNRPEAMAILRAEDRDTPYWRRVLEYSADGAFDAVLLEHAHVVRDLYGFFDPDTDKALNGIAGVIIDALSLRASRQEYQAVCLHGADESLQRQRMRGHFAMRFDMGKADDGDSGLRADLVRDAFNSPFWPFVLATTSRGQEGLDFHAWCHAVVHWNLPANPVDLEQREGRVHRYKGHAIRKNVAAVHGPAELADPARDPWQSLFERARSTAHQEADGIVPFWVYECEDGAFIERHVPALPLSKDQIRLEALTRSLAAYRMVFGQARQDDLLAYLLKRVPAARITGMLHDLMIDLAPRSGA